MYQGKGQAKAGQRAGKGGPIMSNKHAFFQGRGGGGKWEGVVLCTIPRGTLSLAGAAGGGGAGNI